MMRKVKFIAITGFFTSAFVLGLFMADIFAAQAQLEEIKKLEEGEKTVPVPQEIIVRPKVEYQAEGLRDPFQMPVSEKAVQEEKAQAPEREIPPPSLSVQGVIWGGNFPQAIINNRVVKLGDTIEGARIVSIDKNVVIIFFQGRQYNLAPSRIGGAADNKP